MSQATSSGPAASNHTGLLITLTIIAALGGLLFGYDSAVISGATDSIKQNFVAPMGLTEGARLSLEGFTIAGALWGCLIGGALGGVIAHYLGRRGGLIVAGVLFFVSSLGSAWPEGTLGHLGSVLTPLINALIWFLNLFFEDAPFVHFGDVITNFVGHRLFGGMGIGLASMLAPMYIAEIAPPSKRGALVTYQQIAIVSGITISYFVNYFIKKWGGDGDPNWVHTEGWRWMLACCAIPAGIFVLLLFFVPETPRGLMLKGKKEKANEVLNKLASPEEAKIVIAEIDASLHETAGKAVLLRWLRDPRRHPAVGLPAARRHQRGAVLRPADVRQHGLQGRRLVRQHRDHGHRDGGLHVDCHRHRRQVGPQAAADPGRASSWPCP